MEKKQQSQSQSSLTSGILEITVTESQSREQNTFRLTVDNSEEQFQESSLTDQENRIKFPLWKPTAFDEFCIV